MRVAGGGRVLCDVRYKRGRNQVGSQADNSTQLNVFEQKYIGTKKFKTRIAMRRNGPLDQVPVCYHRLRNTWTGFEELQDDCG